MESKDYTEEHGMTHDMLNNLVGELGNKVLLLIGQGFSIDDDIIRFGSITRDCLNIKISVLKSLNLIKSNIGGYYLTDLGSEYLQDYLGWNF